MLSKEFWLDALERAVKTTAQAAIATIGASTLFNQVDWVIVASCSGLGFILSILTSIASSQVGNKDNASLIK